MRATRGPQPHGMQQMLAVRMMKKPQGGRRFVPRGPHRSNPSEFFPQKTLRPYGSQRSLMRVLQEDYGRFGGRRMYKI